MKLYYCDDYTASSKAFETTRKASHIAQSIADSPIPHVEILSPTSLSEEDLHCVHAGAYIQAIKSGIPTALAGSNDLEWNTQLWQMVCASNGGMVEAAINSYRNKVNSGSLSSGLHHAYPNNGAGYCTFNGLAIAAIKAYEAGARAVLILDFDAHCGGGTYACIKNLDYITHADLSVCDYDHYQTDTPHINQIISNAEEYLPAVQALLNHLSNRSFDLCIYNAGMDPYEKCREDGLSGITAATLKQREDMVFSWCADNKIPAAFAIAGGYLPKDADLEKDMAELTDLHRLTIQAAAAYN